VVIRRKLKRRYVLAFFQKLPPCLVGIEACASSHYCARELQALGHTVRLMPPAYVKPYVKRQKNDMADAEAICEAVTRANMRFVPIKMPEQQSGLVLHRTRHLNNRGKADALTPEATSCEKWPDGSIVSTLNNVCWIWAKRAARANIVAILYCPAVILPRHHDVIWLGPLTRSKRSFGGHRQRTECDPKRTSELPPNC
jgi:hypothetical protein